MLSYLSEGRWADEHQVSDDNRSEGGCHPCTRVAVWTGNARRTAAVEDRHQTAAGAKQDNEREKCAESDPEGVVGGAKLGILEQLARQHHGALVANGTLDHYHSVAEKQRAWNEDRRDKDQDGRRHAVASLQQIQQLQTLLPVRLKFWTSESKSLNSVLIPNV